MKTNFKMLEATNKQEAIISINDVLSENPSFLNNCKSDLFSIIYNLHTTVKRSEWLNTLNFEQVKNLFIEIKTEYYNNINFTNRF
jgi:hypothetical protein|tara:strand:+ start:590 stop:844 length:255 start_codon:yes stop_codon:yes gene_type:complete